MRYLISLAFVVAATGLLCHGLFEDDAAQAALRSGGTAAAIPELERHWPYSPTTIEARKTLIPRWRSEGKGPSIEPDFGHAVARVERAFSNRMPWVDPFGAAAIGLAGLALAVLLPGTRFRGMALMGLLLGLVAAFPLYLDEGSQVGLVDTAGFVEPVMAEFPRVAIGLLFLAGFVLGPRSRRRSDDD